MTELIEYKISPLLLTQFPDFQKLEMYRTVEDPLISVQQLQRLLKVQRIQLEKHDLEEDYIKARGKYVDGKIY
jgi:hypothetical protein